MKKTVRLHDYRYSFFENSLIREYHYSNYDCIENERLPIFPGIHIMFSYSIVSFLTDSDGLPHCEDGPAITYKDGSMSWYRHGELHREDGPAVENADGTKEWWKNGYFHRENGPAIERQNSSIWYRHGKRHRVDGPAVSCNETGIRDWYLNGQLHRLDGPAYIRLCDAHDFNVECDNCTKKYFICGQNFDKEQFEQLIQDYQFQD